jgi:hypothetical protein
MFLSFAVADCENDNRLDGAAAVRDGSALSLLVFPRAWSNGSTFFE